MKAEYSPPLYSPFTLSTYPAPSSKSTPFPLSTMPTRPLRQQLTSLFGQAFAAIGADASLGEVVVSARRELAQFQCNGAMAAAKSLKRNPRDVAQAVIDALPHRELFADLSIAGPGFINITVTDDALADRKS